MISNKNIQVKGARVNNLKNIDVTIPRNQFVVITGLSGSGKSSLAFDTLYAEGQRRYVESLSAYARQFLGRMPKPECDFITGLPPAIAIEQKVNTRNSKSTVGTSTEIYDYLRLLFSRIGKTYSPVSGHLVKKHTPEDVLNTINSYPENTKYAILSPILIQSNHSLQDSLSTLQKEGYTRIENNNSFFDINEVLKSKNIDEYDNSLLLIDRLSVKFDKDTISRSTDSIETAFIQGNEECVLKVWTQDGVKKHVFSKRFEEDGITFNEPSDLMFNFNNPIGACPNCEGYGKVLGIDENLVIPNKMLSVYQDAVMCWRGERMGEWKKEFIHMASLIGFPIHRPYYELSQNDKNILWNGNNTIKGINDFFKWIEGKSYSIQYRVLLARYRGKTTCPMCHGSRLKESASYVMISGKTISDLVIMPINELKLWFENLILNNEDKNIANRLLIEINNRIKFLSDIGLGYLTLDRLSSTLSGGESQRINLATSLGSSLIGSLYILDEPSIGLHSRDTRKLIKSLKSLQKMGNTVVVVEHDEDIIRAADYLIDIGPDAGIHGGNVVYQGDYKNLSTNKNSYTYQYLNGIRNIDIPSKRRKWNKYIEIKGAAENNLKNIDVKFPLEVLVVVTGISGSGKSTLVREILYKGLSRKLGIEFETPGTHNEITGDINLIKNIELVDQNPIGKSTRSNPATYLKAYDEIRKLFSEQQMAKQLDIPVGHFSFNSPGGRCEECKGEGKVTVPMQFMADITLECECCHGKRFKQEILEIEYRGKNISDVLDMSVNQAIEFFSQGNGVTEKKIVKRLIPLQQVGLGYIKLGQSSSTLSGGENQRVKLAYFIGKEKDEPTMFIFDEPTTGLHFHDINTLMSSFNKLIAKGHTVIIIEHNMDVIKCADHIIDLGPEGGNDGGNIVFEGTPEDIIKCRNSYTGEFLKEKLK